MSVPFRTDHNTEAPLRLICQTWVLPLNRGMDFQAAMDPGHPDRDGITTARLQPVRGT